LGFAAWTLCIVVVGIGGTRIPKVISGKAKPIDFPGDVAHGGERYRRIMRAHANCVENLPIFGAVVVAAAVAGLRGGLFDTLPEAYLAARVAQSVTHIASGGATAVNIRFSFFIVQIVCVVWLGVRVVALAT
jgi:uncharacterized MAPEG superfamily protein